MIDGPDPNRMWQFHFYFTRLSCRRLTWSLSRTISQLGQTETEIIYTETLSIQFQQTFPTEGHISNRRRPTVHRCSCRHSINLVRTASRIDFSLGAWCNRKLCHLPKSSKVLETVYQMSIWRFERKNFNLKIPCWVLCRSFLGLRSCVDFFSFGILFTTSHHISTCWQLVYSKFYACASSSSSRWIDKFCEFKVSILQIHMRDYWSYQV